MIENGLNLYIYDQNLNAVSLIDAYTSLCWSDRYNEAGEFELSLPYYYGKQYFGKYLIQDNYCGIKYSKRKMIIEKIEYHVEEESAPEMIVSGRSLESILERRLVLSKVDFGSDGVQVPFQTAVESLLNSNIISPFNENRKIPGFIMKLSEDTKVTSVLFDGTYNGEDLYKIISDACKDKKLGFRLMFNEENKLVFELYAGLDRSTAQNVNDSVIFSPYYDTLKSSNYFTSTEEYKNIMYVSIAEDSVVPVFETPEPSGIKRREVLVDQDDLKKNKSTKLKSSEIETKGKQKLKEEYKVKTGIEGDVVPGVLYEYGKDYDVGDRVQVTDIYGNTETVSISEVVITCDEGGLQIIPTFEEIEETSE